MKEARTIRSLLPLLRGSGWVLPATLALGVASSLAESTGFSLFVPLFETIEHKRAEMAGSDLLHRFFQFVLRRLPEGRPLPYIVGLILALIVCKGLLTYAYSILAAKMSSQATYTLRSRVYSRLLFATQQTFDNAGSGRLVNLLATDTWHTGDAISLFIGLLINLSSIAVFAILLVALSWKLWVIVLCGVAAASMLIRAITASARRLGQDGVKANTELSEQMLDALGGFREIQVYGLQCQRQRLFDAISSRVRSIYFRLDLLHRAVSPLSEVLYVSLLLALLLIGVAIHDSIPGVIVFLLVLYRLQPQIRQLDAGRLSLAALTTSVEDVLQFIGTGESDGSRQIGGPPADAQAIEFDRVGFQYADAGEFRMRDISFRIPFGSTTAIVGRSGSGKSTLVSLLCRFYGPSTGEIRVGDRALSEIDVEQWRAQIAWVSQDAFIFQMSVRENIRCGRLHATDEEVAAAAIEADADVFIRQFPDGYDTKIGTGGVDLSSGQRQRLALARAFIRRPLVLILDEATNSLDSLSEEWIREHVRRAAGRHTVILISHRLSSVRHADQVIVLEDGMISERGTPQQLLAGRGFLSRVRELQYVQ